MGGRSFFFVPDLGGEGLLRGAKERKRIRGEGEGKGGGGVSGKGNDTVIKTGFLVC